MREGVGRDDAMGSKVMAVSLNQVGAGMRNLSSTSQSLGNFSMAIDSLLCHLQMKKLRILSRIHREWAAEPATVSCIKKAIGHSVFC